MNEQVLFSYQDHTREPHPSNHTTQHMYRVVKWWSHKYNVSEIMGLVQLFWTTYMRKIHIPKNGSLVHWTDFCFSNCSILNPLISVSSFHLECEFLVWDYIMEFWMALSLLSVEYTLLQLLCTLHDVVLRLEVKSCKMMTSYFTTLFCAISFVTLAWLWREEQLLAVTRSLEWLKEMWTNLITIFRAIPFPCLGTGTRRSKNQAVVKLSGAEYHPHSSV